MIANILDPRYKFKSIKIGFQKENASHEVIANVEAVLKRILMDMYEEYRLEYAPEMENSEANFEFEDDEMEGIDVISMEIARQMVADEDICIKNEVDQYLNDKSIAWSKVFDVAKWWRGAETCYPVLSKLAKDILAVPCSTVASETAFSLGSRIVDPFRACLTPKMVEALVCTSDWFRSKPVNLFKEPFADDLELYAELEEIEKENEAKQANGGGAAAEGAGGAAAVGGAGAAPLDINA